MTKGQTARERASQTTTPSPIYHGAVDNKTEMDIDHTAVCIWTWKFPSTHMEDARCFLMIPPLHSESFISYTGLSVKQCPLFVVTTGDIFQEHHATTKPLFSLALSSLLNCPCPQAGRVLLTFLSLNPPPSSPNRTLINWRETFIGQGDSQQICTLASVVINCNVFRLVVFF